MLPRVIGVPAAALVVLVAAPGLVVRTVGTGSGKAVVVTPATATPAKPSATLKISVSGERGAASPLLLDVRAAGRPDPSTTLVDDSGTHTATVTSDQTGCGRHVYDTGTGTENWCLAVTSLDAGHELTGTLGGGTSLTLAITRRHALWFWPLFVLVAGLLTPLATSWFNGWLKKRAGLTRVARVIDRNERSPRTHISDLGAWAKRQEDAGTAPGDLLKLVRAAVLAPPKLRRARKQLAKALKKTTLAPGHPYYLAARHEARRTSFRVDDFLNADGTTKPARAQEFEGSLAQLEADERLLVELTRLVGQLDDACRRDVLVPLEEAKIRFDKVSEPEDVPSLDDPLVEANAAVSAALNTPACIEGAGAAQVSKSHRAIVKSFLAESDGGVDVDRFTAVLAEAEPAAAREIVRVVRAVTTPALDLRGEQLRQDELVGIALTILALLVALAFAGFTVAKAAYYNNATFVGFWDYFALFSAALASGAAATVLTLVDYWRPKPGA